MVFGEQGLSATSELKALMNRHNSLSAIINLHVTQEHHVILAGPNVVRHFKHTMNETIPC